jgi:hypothetical protein
MIKNKGNNMGKVEDMGVISQIKEKTKRKKVQKIMQNTKMIEHKKKPNKGVTLMHAHKFPIGNDDLKTKEIEKHKKNKQMEKVNSIGLLLLEAFGRWPYMRWC